jgi:hypothetical protein
MQPIELLSGKVAETPGQFVKAIMKAADAQVEAQGIKDESGRADFLLATDALNLNRSLWRYREEFGGGALTPAFVRQMKGELCRRRGYDADDFESALLATLKRMRLPFGWTALDLAHFRAKKQPIRLLDPDLADSRVVTAIAGIALQLQQLQEGGAILLPIEQLRQLLGQRKVVVSGAVLRLLNAGLLVYVNESYHTGKAREFRFIGKEHEHYEEATTSATA